MNSLESKTTYTEPTEWRNASILLIENNSGDAAMFSHYLASFGAEQLEVETVSTLAQALEMMRIKPFEAVVLDLELPDAMGVEAIAELRDICSVTPIIVLTGVLETGKKLDVVRVGVDSYHNKETVSADDLVYSIRVAIDRKRLLSMSCDSGIDEETGLFNQFGFQSVADEAFHTSCSTDQSFCLMHLRIGRPEATTKVDHGLIVSLAQSLERRFRSNDVLARVESLDFIMALTGVDSQLEPAMRERIKGALSEPLRLSTLPLTPSLGIAFRQEGVSTLSTMMVQARRDAIRLEMDS